MNIFFLSLNPKICAIMHCDAHVRKMILEYAQMLCSAHHICGKYKNPNLYQVAFKNNPCTVWTRATSGNYLWLYNLFINLCKEYNYRFGKIHSSQKRLEHCLSFIPVYIPNGNITKLHQAMPERCKHPRDIQAYHNYYNMEKTYFAKWTIANIPYWYKDLNKNKIN
tara:strand:+ start:1769 stop:2266 length:498 start_codon:yes stop_codon:yes gene_type:complete